MKLKIQPITEERLRIEVEKFKNFLIDGLQWYKGENFKGNLEEDTIDLIKNISDKKYKDFHIKPINSNVFVYLDDSESEEHSNTVVAKREDIEHYIKGLQDRIEELSKEYEDLEKNMQKQEYSTALGKEWDKLATEIFQRKEQLENKIEDLKQLLEQNKGEKNITYKDRYFRLGYYTREGRDNKPEIVLLMGTIKNDETLLISTYIHEMFHAHYDWDWINMFQTNPEQANSTFVESCNLTYIKEPLTEYAMLKFLKEFVRKNQQYADLLDMAVANVRRKQSSSGICHYGFGYYLWKWEQEGNTPLCDWIKCYKEAKFKIKQTSDKDNFDSPFTKGLYPFGNESHYMALLYKILMEANGKQTGSIVDIDKEIENKSKKITLPYDFCKWYNLAPNALAAIDITTNTLYLDGAFVGRQFNRKINRFVRDMATNIERVVLWDHFVCDNFNRISSYRNRIVAVSPHNFYYKMKAGIPTCLHP